MYATKEEAVAELTERGYVEVPEFRNIRPGARCRNYGEQFPEAYREGTADVLVVMQRFDGAWERTWHRPDVEVVVQRTRAWREGIYLWADYGTCIVEVS